MRPSTCWEEFHCHLLPNGATSVGFPALYVCLGFWGCFDVTLSLHCPGLTWRQSPPELLEATRHATSIQPPKNLQACDSFRQPHYLETVAYKDLQSHRLHVAAMWLYIHGPGRGCHIMTLGSLYSLESYMEPLGVAVRIVRPYTPNPLPAKNSLSRPPNGSPSKEDPMLPEYGPLLRNHDRGPY